MATVVANMVVGPLVKIVLEKASSYLLDQYKVMKGMEEQHKILKRKLPAILDVITDAEQAAGHRKGAKAWLEEVKVVAYKANEVFDEFKYEALRRKAKKEGHYKELGFDVVKLFPSHNRFIFRNRMGRKLRKIVQAIEVLVTEMNAFGFKYQQPLQVSNQLRQMDHVIFDPEKIISRSRHEDNKKIVNIIVDEDNADLTVVPIVGMGGLGKTTLAQLVYNDPKVKKHFKLLLWVCVSDDFDVDSLAKSIVKAAPKKMDDGTEAVATFVNTPLDSLESLVSGQRYLLVLDDVWKREVDKWKQLKDRLQHGAMGSVVLTTTRDKAVAKIMGTVEAYNLTALEDKFIKEIIEARAFSCIQKEEERPAKLVNMVDGIVKRCVGSPLAATALGSVLCTKTSEEEWNAVSSQTSICTGENGILQILKLSYNELPSDMKQCFAFCAIFPKDYNIDMDKLIQLWIAHGFIIQEGQVRLETIGEQIFRDLASRSFFQVVENMLERVTGIDDTRLLYSRTTCKIHDLMHDVALSVMENECALATEQQDNNDDVVMVEEPSQSEWLPKTARHLFLSCKKPEVKLNGSLKNSSPSIQTLLCGNYLIGSSLQHLSKYISLQALQLFSSRKSFPLNPKHLHHLRYLDLSDSWISSLPKDMSILYNLQTLNLSDCKYLGELPRQMKYMTSLRHLYTHGCPELKSMPRDIRKLKSLQTLTFFVSGSGSDCSTVGELGNLNLGGQLELSNLENVTEEDAKAANLVKKTELRELTLTWTIRSDHFDDESSWENDAKVVDKLKPHDGLHAISVNSYRAPTFPTWIAQLQNIVQIHLFNCKKVQWLFSRGSNTSFAFPNLKRIVLKELVCLERWWKIDYGMQGEEIMFPRLEDLIICDCEKLATLPALTFPELRTANIMGCPKLKTTVESPMLSMLSVEGHEEDMFLEVARHINSLRFLRLKRISPEDSTETTSALSKKKETTSAAAKRSLKEVVDCKEKWNDRVFPLDGLMLDGLNSGITELCACFVHLSRLSIAKSHALVYWPEKEFQELVSLKYLYIFSCNNLTGYALPPAEASTSSETRKLLPSLQSLCILGCVSLVEVFNLPASLRRMKICFCSKLESISGWRFQQRQSALSIHQGSSSIPEVSLSSSPRAGAAHLEELTLQGCARLTGILHLPESLKELVIEKCDGLRSLECCSGTFPSLEHLKLIECSTLSSIPDGLQAYPSLQLVFVHRCPGMKSLPASLQQRLGSIPMKHIDAHIYRNKPTLLKPKTWKYAIRRY